MQAIPSEGSEIILRFSSLFSKKVFEHIKVLLLGTLLCIGNHTVCAALRFMGMKDVAFQDIRYIFLLLF